MNNNKGIKLSDLIEKIIQEKIIALPLQFQYLPVQVISKQFTKLNSNYPYRIHYLGPRFTNTLILHKKYSASYQKDLFFFQRLLDYRRYQIQLRKIVQSHFLNQKLQNNHYYKSAIFYRAFEGMNPTLNLKQQFIFNSCFESGNLDCVIKVNPMEFDLFLRIDSNTRGHTQWFYFSIQNGDKIGKVTLNICNLTKPKSLYQSGMRPYIFSKKKYQKYQTHWQQQGENITLVQKPLRYNMINDMIQSHRVFRLSFQYNFSQTDDEVFFAYSIPYSYSEMLGDINKLPQKYAKKQILGRSLTGVDIPIMHITNHLIQTQKKNILITGRIHPGQSNSSYVLKGFMDYLCSQDKDAIQLRNRINFFIIPMINPDGVIMGNSRTSASGKDLNRQYFTNKRQLYPQVVLIKKLASKIQRRHGLMMYFDFHGHSRKKNTFFYGPGYTLSDSQYYKSKALAKLIQKVNNNFRYYSCSFTISDDKKRTARAVLFQQLKIPYTFTIQSSIGLYYDCNKLKTLQFLMSDWLIMGKDICKGLSQFIVAYEQYQEVLKERRLQRKRSRQKRQKIFLKKNSKKFSEDDFDKDQSNIDGLNVKKNMLMLDLFEQIKQQVPPKIIQAQASSDDHDDAEDLQISKLAQFNNLIIQSKQIDQSLAQKVKPMEEQQQITNTKKIQTQNNQYQIMKQIMDDKQKQKKKSKVFVKTNQKKSIKNNSNKVLRKNFTNPTCSVARSTRLTLNRFQDDLRIKTPNKQPLQNLRQRKSFNYQTHRHLISKQFFPVDKCQIVDLPKSSGNNRKQIKKGRVFLDEYLNEKKKQRQQKQYLNRKAITQQKQVQRKTQVGYSYKMQQLKLNNKKGYSKRDEKNIRYRNTNRIFDSVLFSGFQGMQIDNMAMMIKTFNK